MSITRFFKKTTSARSSSQIAGSDKETVTAKIGQFPLPNIVKGIEEHAEAHAAGNKFSYAAIHHSLRETDHSLVQRIKSSIPRLIVEKYIKKDLPPIKLVDAVHEVTLDSLDLKKFKEYSRVAEVLYFYVPLASANDTFDHVHLTLHDRGRAHTLLSETVFNSNITCNGRMESDHYVPTKNLTDIYIEIQCRSPVYLPGRQWGAIQLQIKIDHSDWPTQVAVNKTMAVIQVPSTFLENLDSNPKAFNATLNSAGKMAMQGMYQRGEITDITMPEKEIRTDARAGTVRAGYEPTKFDPMTMSMEPSSSFGKINLEYKEKRVPRFDDTLVEHEDDIHPDDSNSQASKGKAREIPSGLLSHGGSELFSI